MSSRDAWVWNPNVRVGVGAQDASEDLLAGGLQAVALVAVLVQAVPLPPETQSHGLGLGRLDEGVGIRFEHNLSGAATEIHDRDGLAGGAVQAAQEVVDGDPGVHPFFRSGHDLDCIRLLPELIQAEEPSDSLKDRLGLLHAALPQSGGGLQDDRGIGVLRMRDLTDCDVEQRLQGPGCLLGIGIGRQTGLDLHKDVVENVPRLRIEGENMDPTASAARVKHQPVGHIARQQGPPEVVICE
mmetsp:Transcript_24210/g.43686  ORF Transcript_24210/g.43686 Transcript_24210/m.43686 type:complete len:241 (-) Transcript_24210:141-863(-)